MKIALIGLPQSGKRTLFTLLTARPVPESRRPGETVEGVAWVRDPRIDALKEIFKPKKTTYAEMSFCDVPGEHGSDKKGLSPRGLQQIRDQEALCLVLRDFDNPALEGDPDPVADLESFHAECIFADLESVEKRLERARKERAEPREIAAFELA